MAKRAPEQGALAVVVVLPIFYKWFTGFGMSARR